MAGLGIGQPPSGPSFDGVRIGVQPRMLEGAVDDAVVEGLTRALADAEAAGAVLVEVDVPHQWAAVPAGLTIILAEGAEEQRARRLDGEAQLGADVRAMLTMADQITAATYVRAQRVRATLRRELVTALAQVDVMASPTMPNVAPRADEIGDGQLTAGGRRIGIAESHLRYNIGANLAALPCATQPLPRPVGSLPIGLEWVAAPGRDEQLLAAMSAMEGLWQPTSRR
jgi:aspartyl-tRNA(Asn)/glutamyl-tRNA(Gln) amidotransferase subunit A